MPRQKSFDENKTLEKIGHLFWTSGFVATDMDQICRHVSLTKPSIYNAYGDKGTLFRKVVDWYTNDVLAKGRGFLAGTAPVSDEIGGLLRHFMVLPDGAIVARGCLLATTMMELQHSEPELFSYTQSHFNRLFRFVDTYLHQAQAAGRLRDDANPTALCDYVFTILLGMRVQSRTGYERIELQRLVATAMEPLRSAETNIGAPQNHH